jgi:hypothetical protein
MANTAISQVPHLRSQFVLQSSKAEKALDHAFDLRQSGASAEAVDAALAEVARLQEELVALERRMAGDTLH